MCHLLVAEQSCRICELRNGWYTENYTESVPTTLANNAFYGSAENGKISSALRAELAEAAVNVVLSEEHENQTYELAGSIGWTLTDLAVEISKQTGKEIPYVDIPAVDYAVALLQAGLDEGFAGLIAQWDVDTSNGALTCCLQRVWYLVIKNLHLS
ncbi:Quinone oxidoreductase 2 [Haemophilus influenzae]|nr:hypothetical protein [Haemophilus influenzae]PRI64663.1 Quinone oxidoreductase 2 [Haemophilus influenzae]